MGLGHEEMRAMQLKSGDFAKRGPTVVPNRVARTPTFGQVLREAREIIDKRGPDGVRVVKQVVENVNEEYWKDRLPPDFHSSGRTVHDLIGPDNRPTNEPRTTVGQPTLHNTVKPPPVMTLGVADEAFFKKLEQAVERSQLPEAERKAREQMKMNDRYMRAVKEMMSWIDARDWTLQRPERSLYHNYVQEAKSVILLDSSRLALLTGWEVDPAKPLLDYQPFLIQHDWAAAFRGATDFDSEEFHAPYDHCVFEMQVSGMRWLAFVERSTRVTVLCRTSVGWIAPLFHYELVNGKWSFFNSAFADEKGGPWDFIFERMIAQIKAVCVALEAKVAESEEIDAVKPRQLTKHDLPKRSYHVVHLAHQHRARGKTELDPNRTVIRHRMHFRRGHWRHYYYEKMLDHTHQWAVQPDQQGRCYCTTLLHCPAYRRWVEWQLVGDPDLGFIDKEYRL